MNYLCSSMIKQLIMGLLLLTLHGTSSAGPVFRGYTSSLQAGYGLQDFEITAIAEDDLGFIWASTGKELFRLDGLSCKIVDAEITDALFANNNSVESMLFNEGCLVIFTRCGVYRYDIAGERIRKSPAFGDAVVFGPCTYPDKADTVSQIVVNCDFGIVRYNLPAETVDTLLLYQQDSGAENISRARTIAYDTHGDIWTINGNCLIRIRQGESRTAPETVMTLESLASTPSRIAIDQRDHIFLYRGLYLYSGSLSEIANGGELNRIRREIISVFACDGDVFLGPRGQGILHLRADNSPVGISDEPIPLNRRIDDLSNTVNVFFKDSRDLIWIGTRNGLFCLLDDNAKSPFIHIVSNRDNPSSLSHDTVNDLDIEGRNTVWIATASGLNRISFENAVSSPMQITRFLAPDNEPGLESSNKLEQIAFGPDGLIWLGTKDKISFFNPSTETFSHKEELDKSMGKSQFVRALYRDANGNMWVGFSSGGVYVCRKGEYMAEEVPVLDNQTGLETCSAILSDRNGYIWIGSLTQGLFRLGPEPPGESIRYPLFNERGEEVKTIRSLYVDQVNNLWCGTEEGLFRYIPKDDAFQFVVLPLPEGSTSINGIVSDDLGTLWLSTVRGVCKYGISDGTSSFIIVNGGNLCRKDFVFGSTRDTDGYVYLGGINGVTLFNPRDFGTSSTHGKCVFTDFKYGNHDTGMEQDVNNINYTLELALEHRCNHIKFSFSNLTFSQDDNTQYSYRLSGVDNEWIYAGTGTGMVSYTNIPTGRHLLEIRSTNALGEWGIPTIATIVIRPPLLLSWYFLLAYLLLLAIILFTVRRWTQARTKMKMGEAVSKSKVLFYKEIAHNIRNPYTLLRTPLNKLIEERKSLTDQETDYLLETVKKGSDRLALLVDQMIDYSEIEEGTDKLNLVKMDYIPYTKAVCSAFMKVFSDKGISMDYYTESTGLLVLLDKEQIEHVIFEMLSYIYRNSSSGDEVHVICTCLSGERARLEVNCDGIHLSKDALDSFFNTGMGLSLAREQIALHKGTVEVSCEGSLSLAFTLPLARESTQERMGEPVPTMTLQERIDTIIPAPEPEQYARFGAPLVYVVIADEQMRSFVQDFLSPDIQVKGFADPADVCEMALKEKPRLIISGVAFSRETKGFDLCRQIKGNPSLNHIPFMFLTSYSKAEMEKEGYDAGADAYLTKPFEMDYLKVRIERLLQSWEALLKTAKKEIITTPAEINVLSSDEKFLSDIMRIVEEEISNEDFSVESFSSRMAMSSSMLYRKMKALTGLSPNRFIVDVRLKRAAQLLESQAYTISEVAYKVGFSDMHYFSTCFKRMFGMTPSEYKTQKI